MPLTSEQRNQIISTAKEYLLTPYRPQAQLKGAGVDCASFLLCVYRDTGLVPDINLGNYSVQVHLHRKDTQYLETILKFAREITEQEVQPGDLVLYKIGRRGNCERHSRHKLQCPDCIEIDKDCGWHHGAIIIKWPEQIIHAVSPDIGPAGVIYSHGTKEGFTQRLQKRFFTLR